ncbi:MAG: histidine kinase [Cyclobacteriaceae bacterium]
MRCILALSASLFILMASAQSIDDRITQARDLIRSGEHREAITALEQLLKELPASDSTTQLGHVYRLLDFALWGVDKKQDALTNGRIAQRIFEKNNETRLVADMALRMSLNEIVIGNYSEGLRYGQQSYDLFTDLKDSSNMIIALTRISVSHHDLGNYDIGIQYGKRTIALARQFSASTYSHKMEANTVTAINYDDRGDMDSAIYYHRKTIEFIDKVENQSRVPIVYNNIGNSLLKKGELKEAQEFFQKCLVMNWALQRHNDRSYNLATVITNLGTISYKLGNYQQAAMYLDSGEYYSHRSQDVEKLYDVYYQKYLYFDLIDKDQQALTYLLKYYHLKDSLQDVETRTAVARLETQYATREKENQIAIQKASLESKEAELRLNYILLAAAIAVILLLIIIFVLLRNRSLRKEELMIREKEIELREVQIKAAIASQEKERNRFARDLHDGFGQMISILNLNIKSLEEEKNKTPEVRDRIFENCTKVIENMYDELRSICFDLMPQTLINQGLTTALQEFALRINETGKKRVEVMTFGLEKRLSELEEISLFRIVQEWVNNLLKYNDADRINIQIVKDEQSIILTIEDNGQGFDGSLLTTSAGNGWKNIQTRAKLVKGEINLETKPNKRYSTLMVEIPIAQDSSSNNIVEQTYRD